MNKLSQFAQKFSKRQLVVGGVAVVAAASLLGVGSSALFTSTDTASTFSNNGHVELSVTEKLAVGNILPGVPRSTPISFDNSKSTAKVQLSISQVSTPSVKNPANADLSRLQFTIQDANGTVVYGPVPANQVTPGAINVAVAEGHTWTGKAVWSLPADAGNEYQDVNVHYASVSFTGTQVLP